MAGVNEGAAPLGSEQGSVSVASPIKAAPAKPKFKDPAASSSHVKNRIDTPKRPATTAVLPEPAATDTLAIGNKDYETMLMLEGRFGVFYKRADTEDFCKWATIDGDNFRMSVEATLRGVIRRCLRVHKLESEVNITSRVDYLVPILLNGVCLATYNRLRAVNFAFETEGDRYIAKPKTPNPFEIPKPFAIALQLLGAIEIVSLPKRTVAFPTMSTAEAGRFFLPANTRFRAAEYGQAVEYCKSIGMQFAPVDLSMKCGSAWWLLHGEAVDEAFQLTLPLPESNFTEQDALMHLMFCATANNSFGNSLFTLGELNVGDHGYLLRNPHDDANVNAYFAYSDEPLSQLWKIDG
jgi:hypothetical protein